MSAKVPIHPLRDNQLKAVEPTETAWLSASAGTGKTQVLSSRVLRLLLQPGVEPSQILCLTFTKAGATEMATRIADKLARWVRLDDTVLAKELQAIGADIGPATLAHARTLFAAVLDCPGGGLRIDTIHAFSQWLLGAFPLEADLVPGTRAMEDRDRVLLLRQVLAELLLAAESDPLGDPQLSAALADLSLRMGPEDVEAWLLRCAEAREAWFGPGGWQAADMRGHVLRLLGLPADADASHVAALCDDAVFDVVALRGCHAANAAWKAKTGQESAAAITQWLAGDPRARADGIDGLHAIFFTKKNEPRASSGQEKQDPAYPELVARIAECIARVRDFKAMLALADWLVPALRLGRAFALAWDEAKQREGLIDFDDQIRIAAELLTHSGYAQWIGYKLDRRFDHILVDEAQDTNAAQWRIIDALTQEFFAGIGQRGDRLRTLFVVGDYKQAIFRFQGTSPENFEAARKRVRAAMNEAAGNAGQSRGGPASRRLLELGLDRSFRNAQKLLDFVDAAIAHVGHASFGLEQPPEPHRGEARRGLVSLWRPVGEKPGDADTVTDAIEEGDEGAEGWLSRPDRQLADAIARQVRQWLDDGFMLEKGGKRRATAGDVMVLVRKRRELAGLIVARLHAAGVPVAGVDRLRIGEPLAVRDLLAALRFAAQPLDDLNLACLLGSPLVGWNQEQLLAHAYRDKHVALWDHLRRSSHPEVAAVLAQLGELLAIADFEPPQMLLHWLLSGPWQGRRKLVARLGREANDPIDELLNAAHAHAMSATPSLAGFLNWFDAGEGELKREADNAGGMVRVMTAHGSKGLQARIVILADATGNPDQSRGIQLDMPDPANEERCIPLPGLRSEERTGRIAEHHARVKLAEEQEHWRLLYVAMTRAEEALFIGGALGSRDKGVPPARSWYARLREIFGAGEWTADPIWGDRLDWGDPPAFLPRQKKPEELPLPEPLPRWLDAPPPAEPRPPRPLAPSSLGEDVSADPPWPPGAGAMAARRGVLVHRLLERLPEVPPGDRAGAGSRWLSRHAAEFAGGEREEMLASALTVLETQDWAALFGPGSLAEVPIAATVGARVVAGTIDRLLIEPDRIRVIDFKTARRAPETLAEVPIAILRQMAAYVAALEGAYPGRVVEAALLYTSVPRLLPIPAHLLDGHKQALVAMQ